MDEDNISEEDKVWADASQSAVLIDGDKSIPFFTLGEAVIARAHLPDSRRNGAMIRSAGRVFTPAEIDRLHHRPAGSVQSSALRVLVDLQKVEGADGAGEVVLTYQCARPTTRQVGVMTVPDIENYFETEKLPYETDEEGEELMQQHLKYLRTDLCKPWVS